MSVERTPLIVDTAINFSEKVFLNNLSALFDSKSNNYDIAALKTFFESVGTKFQNAFNGGQNSLSKDQLLALKTGIDKMKDAAMQLGIIIDKVKSGATIDKAISRKVSDAFKWAREGAWAVDNAKIYGPPSITSSLEAAIATARQK